MTTFCTIDGTGPLCYTGTVMGLFSRGPRPADLLAERLDHLERELSKIASELRQLQTEQIRLHADARRWMQRARAAERRAGGPGVGDASTSPAVPPSSPRPTGSSARLRMSPLTIARLGGWTPPVFEPVVRTEAQAAAPGRTLGTHAGGASQQALIGAPPHGESHTGASDGLENGEGD